MSRRWVSAVAMHWIQSTAGEAAFLRQGARLHARMLVDDGLRPRYHRDNFFVLERALVDGTLPRASAAAYEAGWLHEHHWDALIYLNKSAGGKSGQTYSWVNSLLRFCGTSKPLREQVFSDLARLGFITDTGRTCRGCTVWQLMMAPSVPPFPARPSGIARTSPHSLEDAGRSYLKVPQALMEKPTHVWKKLGDHALRKVLMALYSFNDLKTYGGVNPNNLRIEGDRIGMDDAFLTSCVHGIVEDPDKEVKAVAGALSVLRNRALIYLAAAEFESGRTHPAAQLEIRRARRCEASAGDGALIVPRLQCIENPAEASCD